MRAAQEPGLAVAGPVWVIQSSRQRPKYRTRDMAVDPICVVIDGEPLWIGTAGTMRGSGWFSPPLPASKAPDLGLPPLAP